MSAWIFLLLAWLAGFAAPTQDPAPAERVTCPTCAGTGMAEQPCLRCKGSKSYPCLGCSTLEVMLEQVTRLEALAKLVPDDKILADRAKVLRDLLAATQDLEKILDLGANAPKRSATVRCPICFANLLRQSTEPCKNCRGTNRVDCPTCDAKGRRPCGECQRKGTQRRPCESCNGAKVIVCPTTQPSDASCPWCGISGWRDCVQCEHDGMRTAQCSICNGGKTIPCADCLGSKRARCDKCAGDGQLGSGPFSNSKGECKNCKATGRVPCETCRTSGKTTCNGCGGKLTRRSACENCHGARKTACGGCSELSARAWEISAELLASTGARDDALAYWKIVESRTERRFAALLERALGNDARKDVENARTAELARVRKKIEALKG